MPRPPHVCVTRNVLALGFLNPSRRLLHVILFSAFNLNIFIYHLQFASKVLHIVYNGKRRAVSIYQPPGMIMPDQTMRGLRSYMIIWRGRSDQLLPLRSYASNSSRSSATKDGSDNRLLCISYMIACYSTIPPFADANLKST